LSRGRHALVVLLCYGAAVVAAPFLILILQYTGTALGIPNAGFNEIDAMTVIVWGITLTLIYATLPFLLAIGLMRLLKRSDWPTHAVLGMVVGYVSLCLVIGPFWPSKIHDAQFLLAGFGCGIVYWQCRRRFGWPESYSAR
jgi:hypothetical protein